MLLRPGETRPQPVAAVAQRSRLRHDKPVKSAGDARPASPTRQGQTSRSCRHRPISGQPGITRGILLHQPVVERAVVQRVEVANRLYVRDGVRRRIPELDQSKRNHEGGAVQPMLAMHQSLASLMASENLVGKLVKEIAVEFLFRNILERGNRHGLVALNLIGAFAHQAKHILELGHVFRMAAHP